MVMNKCSVERKKMRGEKMWFLTDHISVFPLRLRARKKESMAKMRKKWLLFLCVWERWRMCRKNGAEIRRNSESDRRTDIAFHREARVQLTDGFRTNPGILVKKNLYLIFQKVYCRIFQKQSTLYNVCFGCSKVSRSIRFSRTCVCPPDWCTDG